MEAALLIFEAIGIALVLVWMGRGQGQSGLFAWRPDPGAFKERRSRPRTPADRRPR